MARRCTRCGGTRRVQCSRKFKQLLCANCNADLRKAPCYACGQKRRVARQTRRGPLCRICYENSRKERCIICRRSHPVAIRTPRGPMCRRCVHDQQAERCHLCHLDRPVAARRNGLAICHQCYHNQVHLRSCANCGERRDVHWRDPWGRPWCGRCHQRLRRHVVVLIPPHRKLPIRVAPRLPRRYHPSRT